MAEEKLPNSYPEMRSLFLTEINMSYAKGSVDNIKSKWNLFTCGDLEKQAALEQALRDKVIELLYSKKEPKALESFLELVLNLCKMDLAVPLLSVSLLGDILDSITIPETEQLFQFIESNVSTWKTQRFFSSCKNSILRMCNDLLRRLSKAANTVFCGRILLFLAMFFPFSERSGLNIISEFNVDNLPRLLDDDDVDEEPIQTVELPIKLGPNFYSQFWSLQEFFRSPNLCYNKSQWKEFVKNSNAVLGVFKNFKLDHQNENENNDGDMFFTKFLTNPKLLLLHLSDSDFRRTIFLQFLILFQYLTSQIKTKQDSNVLKSDQLEWVSKCTETVHNLIKESPPDGQKFFECVQLLIKREEHWSAWKNDGCPALKKVMPNYDKSAVIKSPLIKKGMANLLHQEKCFDKLVIPRPEGSKIVDLREDYLKYLPGRNCSPEVNDFLAEAIQQSETPDLDIKDKKVSDPRFGWIALKLLSMKSPYFFANIQSPISRLPDFADHICKRIYREQNPGLCLPPLTAAPKKIIKSSEVSKNQTVKVQKVVTVKKTNDVKNQAVKVNNSVKKDDKGKIVAKTVLNDKKLIKTEKGIKNEKTSNSKLQEKGTKKEKSPVKRKHSTDLDDENSTHILLKKTKDKKDDRKDDDESIYAQTLTSETISKLAKSIAGSWKNVAKELGYKEDELEYFEKQQKQDYDRALNLLLVWTSNEEDATPESLRSCLKTLGLTEAVKILSPA